MKRWWINGRTAAAVAVVFAFAMGFRLTEQDYFFKINKSIDIFGRVYREVTMNYVDTVDPERFMEAGIDGLLETLDPYTTFIREQEGDEIELITNGTYGGIGVTIGLRDGIITILSLMEGYSAQRQGVQPGDKVIAIDGIPTVGATPESVRSKTRGEPGTEVRLTIEREGEQKQLEFVLVREEIQLHNVTYSEILRDGIGYVHLERFSRGAGEELALALKDLKLKGDIRGLILDLRDNPGGLLEAAVDVVEKFLPKGSLVVTTRGKRPDSEKKYFVTEEPLMPEMPVVVLVNRGSASASEIVAGAVQDLDRGVILGTRTFGKGLVQTIIPLAYNTQMKITTAKYYTPSGRCIQEVDYLKKDQKGIFSEPADTQKHSFTTLNGRPEYAGGGIAPDSVVPDPEHSSLHADLLRKAMYFKFATRYASLHRGTSAAGISADTLLASFRQYLLEQKFTYEDEGEAALRELSKAAEKAHYGPTVLESIEGLKRQLRDSTLERINLYRQEITSALREELQNRYRGERGRIEESLREDAQVLAAAGLLENRAVYRRLLKLR